MGWSLNSFIMRCCLPEGLHSAHLPLPFFSLGSSAYSALVALNTTAVGLLYERDDYSAISYRPIDLKDAQAAHDEQQ